MKLELKHIVGYLPYSLKLNDGNFETKMCASLKFIDHNYHHEFALIDQLCSTNQSWIKPILRPLSDLTKEIDIDREKFVPIIELFQIAFGGSYTSKDVLIKSDDKKIYVSTSISKLCFYPKIRCFDFFEIDFDGDDYSPTINQLRLFEKLYEWHFDLHSLIEKNLAIDINTITLDKDMQQAKQAFEIEFIKKDESYDM